MAPRLAVDTGRDERVVDVADSEDPGVEVECLAADAVRVPGAVETLVVVSHEAERRVREATQVTQEPHACLRMALDELELDVGEAGRLAEHLAGNGQLAHVVEEAAEREPAQASSGKTELLSDLDRTQRHAPRVLLGRGVLLGEGDEQRPHVRAEERLLLRDELDCAEVSDQWPRHARAAVEVERDGTADKRDPDELEAVAEPPAEVRVVEHERRHERGREPDDPDGDQQVGEPLRQP